MRACVCFFSLSLADDDAARAARDHGALWVGGWVGGSYGAGWVWCTRVSRKRMRIVVAAAHVIRGASRFFFLFFFF